MANARYNYCAELNTWRWCQCISGTSTDWPLFFVSHQHANQPLPLSSLPPVRARPHVCGSLVSIARFISEFWPSPFRGFRCRRRCLASLWAAESVGLFVRWHRRRRCCCGWCCREPSRVTNGADRKQPIRADTSSRRRSLQISPPSALPPLSSRADRSGQDDRLPAPPLSSPRLGVSACRSPSVRYFSSRNPSLSDPPKPIRLSARSVLKAGGALHATETGAAWLDRPRRWSAKVNAVAHKPNSAGRRYWMTERM